LLAGSEELKLIGETENSPMAAPWWDVLRKHWAEKVSPYALLAGPAYLVSKQSSRRKAAQMSFSCFTNNLPYLRNHFATTGSVCEASVVSKVPN
jgi:hypothetical protein